MIHRDICWKESPFKHWSLGSNEEMGSVILPVCNVHRTVEERVWIRMAQIFYFVRILCESSCLLEIAVAISIHIDHPRHITKPGQRLYSYLGFDPFLALCLSPSSLSACSF